MLGILLPSLELDAENDALQQQHHVYALPQPRDGVFEYDVCIFILPWQQGVPHDTNLFFPGFNSCGQFRPMVCRYQISQYSGRASLEKLREGSKIVAAFGFHDEVAVEVYKVRNIIQNYGIPCHKTATILSI